MSVNNNLGTVFWFTGLSGAGKTTIGHLYYEHIKATKANVVFLDGDVLREVFGSDLGHSIADRKKSAQRNSRLCKMLASQGVDVVCATISMFHESREWNRANIPHYKEIYVKVPIEVLIKRDQKQLYSRALRGEVRDIMGVDLEIEEPRNPDIVIDNSGEIPLSEIMNQLVSKLNTKRA